jgi:hypothetical protein
VSAVAASCCDAAHPGLRSEIEYCAEVLLNADSTSEALSASVQRLFEALERASSMLDSEASRLAHGKALSPRDAAHCLLDYRRTAQFLRGANRALRDAARRWPQQRLRVLYAGCGPWAPLMLLLAPRWGDRIALHLVDAHAAALRNARELFERIGAGTVVVAAECGDAALLRLPPSQRPHVVIAEVMQSGLAEEAQVAITAQLGSQMLPGGILVPKRILVRAVLARLADEFAPQRPRTRIDLAPLIDVSLQSVPHLMAAIAAQLTHLGAGSMTIPKSVGADLGVMLCTRIEVAAGIVLDDYDSGITYPVLLHALGTVRPGQRLAYSYRLGAHPGFECKWDDPSSGA